MTEKNNNPPTKKPAEIVASISKKVARITEIAQIAGEFTIQREQMDADTALRVGLTESPATARVHDAEHLAIVVGYGFEAREKLGDDNELGPVLVKVSAKFLVRYQMNWGDEGPPDEGLEDFAEINGRFNTTSYWREYVNNCLTRGGLPPFAIEPFDALARMRELNKSKAVAPPPEEPSAG